MVLVFHLWQGYKVGVQNKFILVKEGEWVERKHSKLYVSCMCQSGFNQVKRGIYIYVCVFIGSNWHGCVVWLGELKIHRLGGQGGQPGTLRQGLKQLFTGGISSASGRPRPRFCS